MSEKILIIEDEKELAEILCEYLTVEGYEVQIALDGAQGLRAVTEYEPQLLLLDIMLPQVDGITVCKQVRRSSQIPIIMLSAKSGEMDKVICLGIGADDYVTKPFSPVELMARVKAQLRRSSIHQKGQQVEQAANTHGQQVEAGSLRMNRESYTAALGEHALPLTTKEFDVLFFFAGNPGRVFSKEQIYDHVWGGSEYGDISSVAVYIRRLREKLSMYDADYIKTVWGVGYKFTVRGDLYEQK